ncbi:MAG: hypothetical protein HC888_03520 [Candidatus Competibacteraceae bacterium]|nr:hypothetical protein [Candidatus Competibacteraceae bacterium]
MPSVSKKKAGKTAVPEKKEAIKPAKSNHITFGAPIDTDKIRVEVEGTVIRYLIKSTGERLEKDYENTHAVMIIYGRISRDPNGPYTQACVGKIRASKVKILPL